jgi:hypothetical protein
MTTSPKTEFYADHVVYKLEKVTSLLLKLMWWMGVFIFGIVFIGLVFRANKMNETLHDLENYLTNRFPYQDLVLVLSLPFWLWIFISIFPTIVKWSRQFLLYPKSSITQRDTAVIQLKEKAIHRHSKPSYSASYYLGVHHPTSSKLIRVEIDRDSYDTLEKGDRVDVKYHPTEMNILCLKIRQ